MRCRSYSSRFKAFGIYLAIAWVASSTSLSVHS